MINLRKHKRQLFERTILPHLEAAYNLARWITSNASDADDVVQDAYLKAFRLFDSFEDQNSRAWILTIVRNASYTWLQKHNKYSKDLSYDEIIEQNDDDGEACFVARNIDPCDWLSVQSDIARLYRAIEQLPLKYKEIVILREIEGCDYSELSRILTIAPGTVMSRLSRARARLQQILVIDGTKEKQIGEIYEL